MAELLIFDRHDNLITILSNEAEQACPFWDAPFKEILNGGATFEFTVPADYDDAQHVTAENQVAFLDKDSNFRLFVIKEPEKINGENGAIIRAICEPAMYELSDEIIEDIRPQNTTLQIALQRALEKTRWQAGITADFGLASTNYYYINAIQAINKMVDVWGGEIRDRVEIDKNKIIGRYIDILPRRGADTGKVWEIDKDILTISHKVQSYPKTALYGRGSSLEIEDTGGFTRKISFANVEWKVANGDPVDKPYGQEWVGDPSALTVYGRKNDDGTLRHRFGLFENSDQKDPFALLRETWDALQKQKHPIQNYAMDVFLLEEITGHEHEKARLGDTTIAIDRSFAEPIEVEERVVVYAYDVADPDNTGHVELGQYIDFYADDNRLEQVESKLNDLSGVIENERGPVTDTSIINITPAKVTGFEAAGAFKNIIIAWDYVSAVHIANYELFASKVQGFAPDPSNMVFRGKTSGYNFEAETDEVWYFRVRAVNTHGVAGTYSDEVTASTVRVLSDDILFGPEVAAELNELSKTAELLSKEATDKIVVPAFDYVDGKTAAEEQARILALNMARAETAAEINSKTQTAQEAAIAQAAIEAEAKANTARIAAIQTAAIEAQNKVDAAKNALTADIAQKVDATWVNGQLVKAVDDLKIGGRNLFRMPTVGIYFGNAVLPKSSKVLIEGNKISALGNPVDLIGNIIEDVHEVITISGKTNITGYITYYRSFDGGVQSGFKAPIVDGRFAFQLIIPIGTQKVALGLGEFPYVNPYYLEDIKVENGNKATDWTPAPEDIYDSMEVKADKSTTYTKTETDNALNSKVSTLTYTTEKNGIISRLNAAETGISQSAKEIALRAKQTDLEAVHGRLATAEASLTVIPGQIASKVSQTTYDAKVNTLQADITSATTRIKNAESSITQQAGEISQRVTKNEFDKLEIGGRNLFAHSSTFAAYKKGSDTGNHTISEEIPDIGGAYQEINFTHAGNIYFYPTQQGSKKQGETYTISLEVRSTASYGVYWYPSEHIIIPQTDPRRIPNTEGKWQKWSFTYTQIGGDNNTSTLFGFEGALPGEVLAIRKIKLEKGNKATDWTPAPEDADNEILTTKERVTATEGSIITLAGQINLKASSSEVAGLSGRIVTAEQSINGITGAIEQRVTKTEFGNLKIGGRNLFRLSGVGRYAGGTVLARPHNITIVERKISVSSDPTDLVGARIENIDEVIVISGKTNLTGHITYYYAFSNTGQLGLSAPVVDGRFIFQLKVPIGATYLSLGLGRYPYVSPYYLEDVKVENGNKATDWTPAPEDVDGAIASTNSRVTSAEGSVTTLAGQVALKANQTSVDNLSGRLATAEASLTVIPGQIASKVEQTDFTGQKIVSLVNQTADTYKIKAKNIELSGDVSIVDGLTKIANLAVGNAQIAAGAITAAKIARATITAAEIAGATITSAEIANAAITSAKIASMAVGTAAIANAAITNAKIALLAVDTGELRDAAITNAKIANLAVDSAKIASAAITSAKIADAAITNAKIANATITSAKIASIEAGKITAGTLTGFTIQTSAYTWTPRVYMGGSKFEATNGANKITMDPAQWSDHASLRIETQTTDINFQAYGGRNTLSSNGAPLEIWSISGMSVAGSLSVSGSKNATVPTSIGNVNVSAYETAEYYFGDIGRGEIIDGECLVEIEPLFAETVNTDIDYEVFLTPYGRGVVYVDPEDMQSDHFVVRGDNIPFAYEIKAKRKGYEDTRLEMTYESEVSEFENQDAS